MVDHFKPSKVAKARNIGIRELRLQRALGNSRWPETHGHFKNISRSSGQNFFGAGS